MHLLLYLQKRLLDKMHLNLFNKILFYLGRCYNCGSWGVSREITGYWKKAECPKCHKIYEVNEI